MAGRLTTQLRWRVLGIELFAATLVVAALTLPPASHAQNSSTGHATTTTTPSPSPPSGQAASGDEQAALQTKLGRRQAAAVEHHIATLHSNLHITPVQEPLWRSLAAAMRDNVVQLDNVYAERQKSYGSMSAVDDLKSYGKVQQTHADNVQKLIGPFQALYDNFSPAQKKEADETFRKFTDTAVKSSR
jgi:periplasmic protein CpxP/Spy